MRWFSRAVIGALALFAVSPALAQSCTFAGNCVLLDNTQWSSVLPSGVQLTSGSALNVLAAGANPASSGAGSFDNTAIINTLLATPVPGTTQPADVFLPGGSYHITNSINIAPGQCLAGAGWQTIIDVDMDFSTSAAGIIIVTPTNNKDSVKPCIKNIQIYEHLPPDITASASSAILGATSITVTGATGTITNGMYVYDATTSSAIPITVIAQVPATTVSGTSGSGTITVNLSQGTQAAVNNGDVIRFAQPRSGFAALGTCNTATAGGAPCQYPWAIYNNGAQNMDLDYVSCADCYNGVYQRGQTFHFGYIGMSAFNIGMDIDSAPNFSQLDDYLFWNFSITQSGANSANPTALADVFYDGSTIAANIGRVDGIAVGKLQSFVGIVNLTSNFTFGHFDELMLDDDYANLNISACNHTGVQIGKLYSSKFALGTGPGISMTASPCEVTIGQISVENSNPTYSFATVTGAQSTLTILGGTFSWTNTGNSPPAFFSQSNGRLNIFNTELKTPSAPGTGFTFINQSGGWLRYQDNAIISSANGGGSTALSLTDSSRNVVGGNSLGAWGFTPPGPLGDYEPEYQALYTGAGTYTYTPRVGYSRLRVRGCGWGGPGGSGAVTSSTAAASGGAGGGSALCMDEIFPAPAGNITVTIGAAPTVGAVVTANTPTAGNPGVGGGTTTISGLGTTVTLFAGGAGSGGQAAATSGGGGSAGLCDSGGVGSSGTGGTAGCGGGQAGGNGVAGGVGLAIGCGGAGSGATGIAVSSGVSVWRFAAGCGASGGGLTASNGANNGGAGGRQWGSSQSSPPAAGTSGTPTGGAATAPANDFPGSGAAGGWGGPIGTATAGTGGAGSNGDGGGGGGSCAYSSSSCTSGAGGQGGIAFVELIPVR